MSYVEGKIEIPLEEFWEFVSKYDRTVGMETAYGVPKIENDCMTISFAASSDGHPGDWNEKPAAVLEWETLKKGESK